MAKQAVLGFVAGVRAVFGGIGFVVTSPRVWPWAAIPVLVAALLFAALGGGAVAGASALAGHIVTGDGGLSSAGAWTLRVLFGLVGLVLAFVVAISLAQPLSGFALEAVARRQEGALGGPVWPEQPFIASALRSLKVSLTALVIGVPVLGVLALITVLFPPAGVVTLPLKFIVTGLLAAYDLLDYPLGLRGVGVRARLAFMRSEFWAVLGFGVGIAGILLLPGVGLFLLPFGVAGATRLVAECQPNASRTWPNVAERGRT